MTLQCRLDNGRSVALTQPLLAVQQGQAIGKSACATPRYLTGLSGCHT